VKKKTFQLLIVLFIGIFVFSCNSAPKYPVEPQVSFVRAEQSETVDILEQPNRLLKFVFHVLDGDGDIGLKDSEEGVNDVFMTLYRKDGNEMVIDTVASPRYKYRIPYAMPLGQDKTLDADISIDIGFLYTAEGELPYDTIMFEFYIKDRAGNISNTERSPKIGF